MNLKMLALADALDQFLLRVSKKEKLPLDWKKLHQIADDMMPPMREAFLKAVAKLQGSISLSKVNEALTKGDIEAAMDSIDWPVLASEMAVVETILSGIAVKTGMLAVDALPESLGINYSFDLVNQVAVDWSKGYTGDLITQITEGSKNAIRAIIADAMENGGHPYDTARKIRQYIGLTEKDAEAVLNYWRKLSQEADLTAQRVNDMADTYARKLIKERAETIARTETINAAAEGQRKLWENAASGGSLGGFERTWIVTEDDRLCPLCAAMEGQRAPIGGTYPNGSSGPTLHPRCRCAEGLVEVKGKI